MFLDLLNVALPPIPLAFIQFLPLIAAGVGAAGGLIAGNQAKKAAQGAANASQVDIAALDAKTREIARRNALESAELEQQLTPEVTNLRRTATQGVTNQLGDSPEASAASSYLMGNLGKPVAGEARSPLLQAAIEKARAELGLGGQLDVETKNQVMRAGLAKSGAVSGGLGLGRDITARDLGLTSLGLQQQRLQNAAQLGGQEQGMEEFNVGTQFNNAANLLNQVQLLRSIGDARFGRNLAAAQLGQSIQRPVVGLDPGSIADVTVGNANSRGAALSNQANIAGQQGQNWMNFAGQAAGYGLLNYNNNQKPKTNVNSSMWL